MRKVILCDLDGTLADCEHRQHYVRDGKKSWKKFFDGMYDDTVNRDLNEVLIALSRDYEIIFVSARPADYMAITIKWLLDKAGWEREEYGLYMRAAGDYRRDDIVKKELLDAIRADGCDPLIVFDDRKQVVDMWRLEGVLCAQVADHDF